MFFFFVGKQGLSFKNTSQPHPWYPRQCLVSLMQDKSDLLFFSPLFSLSSYLWSCVCVAGHLAVFTELLFVTVAGGRAACLAGGRVCGGTLGRERSEGGGGGVSRSGRCENMGGSLLSTARGSVSITPDGIWCVSGSAAPRGRFLLAAFCSR